MPEFNHASTRQWSPSRFFPQDSGWERSGLYNDQRRTDTKQGRYTTLVRHAGPAAFDMNPLDFEWEIFVLDGDLEIDLSPSERTQMSVGDHCVVRPGERVCGRTTNGCQHLIIARD